MRRTKVLFWNTNKNSDINRILGDIITENQITIAVLAEYTANLDELFSYLNDKNVHMKEYKTIGCDRITIIGFENNVIAGRQTDYASFQIINNSNILCCVHLPSKIYTNSEGMRDIIIDAIIADIISTEKQLRTEDTIVVGDFNINPYDFGCLDASKFHGLPIYEEAKKERRIIAGKEHKMFYNPMWNFFGDMQKPYGTYYYSGNKTNNPFWQIYDQVFIRPSLRNRFVDSSLKIITETEMNYLLNRNGHPDKRISDHLPIVFEIQKEDYYGKET